MGFEDCSLLQLNSEMVTVSRSAIACSKGFVRFLTVHLLSAKDGIRLGSETVEAGEGVDSKKSQ